MRNKVIGLRNYTLNEIIIASRDKMVAEGCNQKSIDFFLSLLVKIYKGERGLLEKGKHIKEVSEGKVVDYAQMVADTNNKTVGQKNLGKVAVIKLNGGLGTSMGLDKAKSLLSVTETKETYLDILVAQMEALRNKTNVNIPLIFLNSFNTQNDTLSYLADKYPSFNNEGLGLDVLQNKYPKLDKNTLMPASHSDDKLNWNPPGHGDIYTTLYSSGMLQKMLDNGVEYAFISNSDNLAATVDPVILGYMVENGVPFFMETAERTKADKKGGHLAEEISKDNLILRELANCSDEEAEDNFGDISLWKDFNTNNIWVDLRKLKEIMDANNGIMPLDLILNSKKNNPTSSALPEDKTDVYQVETAMGSAIRYFPGARAVRIDTNQRFLPTKKASDLKLLKSDAIVFDSEGIPVLNGRKTKPVVLLDSKYKTEQNLSELCPQGIPSLKGADFVEIKGKVIFGKDVVIQGEVEIINNSSEPLIIKDGTLIKDEKIIVN